MHRFKHWLKSVQPPYQAFKQSACAGSHMEEAEVPFTWGSLHQEKRTVAAQPGRHACDSTSSSY